ncbi:MAG TPA: hypothetical protein VNN72_19820 [Polyangiaceae bacterium]|nr:hypothetical protein [Polyangiaceae bacterium]
MPPTLTHPRGASAVDRRPSEHLDHLARSLAKVRLDPKMAPSSLGGILKRLSDLHGQSLEAILALDSDQHSAATSHACEVARLGLAAARSVLEQHRDHPHVVLLYDFRQKTYVALLLMRYTLLGEQNERAPLWRTLLPALSARRALASCRDALSHLLPPIPGDLAWASLVARSELRLLRAQAALGMLAQATRDEIARAQVEFREGLEDPLRESGLGTTFDALGTAFDELNAREDLRQNDERALHELVSLLHGNRAERGFSDAVRDVLFALRGRDSELDALGDPADDTLALPWSLLSARASEILAEHFGTTFRSGIPPRRRYADFLATSPPGDHGGKKVS